MDSEQLVDNFRGLLDLLDLDYLRQDPDYCLGLEEIQVAVTGTHYKHSISAMGSPHFTDPEIKRAPNSPLGLNLCVVVLNSAMASILPSTRPLRISTCQGPHDRWLAFHCIRTLSAEGL